MRIRTEQLAQALAARLEGARIKRDEPLSAHTTFQIGGPADLLIEPASPEQVGLALSMARAEGVPACVIGCGSNLLVRDGGWRGLIVKLSGALAAIEIDGHTLRAQAGAQLSHVCAAAQRAGLSGLAFACGIPGAVGGAVAMNAGAYGGEMRDVIKSALVHKDGHTRRWTLEDIAPSYRTTRILREGGVVLDAEFSLAPGDSAQIATQMDDLNARRRQKQPLDLPNAGSTFKRPKDRFVGPMIDACGLRGAQIGGARVSDLHAGFIVNVGGATARDVLDLIALIKARVLKEHGVNLDLELRVIGEA